VSREKAWLLAVVLPQRHESEARESLEELALLADSAGAQVMGSTVQFREALDGATYLGSGKAEEAKAQIESNECSLALVDDELRPSQQRNLEEMLGVRVVDRTQLILDIFAQRAQTNEGKLQVELAQLEYLLPRLVGGADYLSRQGGGIGTRGPGETKLESDRRRLRDRIAQLKRDIAEVSRTRAIQRRHRHDRRAYAISLAGYTNAGKSSLFNALTGAEVMVQDRLFATLDPTLRPLRSGGKPEVVLSDTVGFVRRLPHALVAAFRATLEEVAWADHVLHVADGSSPELLEQIETVHQVLEDIRISLDSPAVPRTLVLNKADKVPASLRRALLKNWPEAVWVSALEGEGQEALIHLLKEKASQGGRKILVELPAEQAWLLDKHYSGLKIISRKWKGDILKAELCLYEPNEALEAYGIESHKA
jgi:GTP-binding protein HflX